MVKLKVNKPIALCQLSDRADTCIFEDCPLYEKCYPEWLRKEIEVNNEKENITNKSRI